MTEFKTGERVADKYTGDLGTVAEIGESKIFVSMDHGSDLWRYPTDFKRCSEMTERQNDSGRWESVLPMPSRPRFRLRWKCMCGRRFWTWQASRAHYRQGHQT